MLNFNDYCSSLGQFTTLFIAYQQSIAVQKTINTNWRNIVQAFWFTADGFFAYIKKSVKLIEERFSKQTCSPRSFVLYQLQTFTFFIFLRFRSLNFAGMREKNIQKDRFHGNGPYCKIPTEN